MKTIEVENLTRSFKQVHAVKGISFHVEQGEIFGFLGPNGAGKTTTIRMLIGQLPPTSGMAHVAGYHVAGNKSELKQQIGVVFEHQNIYERMTGLENLAFAAELYQVKKDRIIELLNQVGLLDKANQKAGQYSNGMKQRLVIARAILHRPAVLFLDEPTRGLDPIIAREIRTYVKELAKQGMTVFLTTHYMEEADQLCQRVAFMNEGKIVALDSPDALKAAHGEGRIKVSQKSGEVVYFDLKNPDHRQQLGTLALSDSIGSVHSMDATLEDVFIKLTGKSLA